MNEPAPAIKPFPFGQTLLWLSMIAAVMGLACATIAMRQFPGEALNSVIAGTLMVYAVSAASLWFFGRNKPESAQSLILVHFAGVGGRALLCILLGLFGVFGLGLVLKPLLLTIALVYLPLVVVESVFVARHVRASYEAQLGVTS